MSRFSGKTRPILPVVLHSGDPVSFRDDVVYVKYNERVNSGKFRPETMSHVNLAPLVTLAPHGRMILRDITWLYVNLN